MASAGPSAAPRAAAESSVEEGNDASVAVAALLEKIRPNPLECRVCAKELTAGTTAMLPCCHGFHRECLKRQAEAHKGTPLRCGVCGTVAGGVKTAVDVEKLPKHLLAEAQVAEQVHCKLCEEDGDGVVDAVAKCTTCNKPLCESHRGLHKIKKLFTGHTVEPLAVATASPVCVAHPGKPLEIYCMTCSTVCCSLCVVKTHKAPDHDTAVLTDHAPDLRKELKSVHATGAQRSEELVEKLGGLHATLGDVDTRTSKLNDEVRRTIKVLMQRLALREEELLREIGTQTAEERAALEAEQGEDQRRWLALEGALRAAQQLAAPESSVDHLGRMAAPVEAHLATTACEAVAPPPPAALIEFVVSDDVARVLSSVGRFVHRRAYGPECIAEGPGTARATVSTGGQFTVTAWTRSKERVTVGGDRVTARLVSAVDGSATEATVVDVGDGTYTVSYAVASAGEYRLDVVVNGRAVRGSPFAVTVAVSVGRLFTFTGPPFYDNNGVIYYLATAGGTRPWANPHEAGVVTVSFSSDAGYGVNRFVANKAPAAGEYCHTNSLANSWMSVSLNGRRVIPNTYVISSDQYGLSGADLLRSWRLEGSLDGTTWTTLRTHTNDTTLTAATLTGYWPVDGASSAFSNFRILHTGPNTSGDYHLMASSLEIYGELLDL